MGSFVWFSLKICQNFPAAGFTCPAKLPDAVGGNGFGQRSAPD